MISTKTCSKCNKEKPFSEFNKGKDKYGLHIWCRECYKAWAAEYYKRNKDKISEKHKQYHIKNHDKIRERQRIYSALPEVKAHKAEYAKDNYEHIREYQREYYKKNREHIRKKKNEYYHNNKDKARVWRKRYKDSHKEQIKESGKRYRQENRGKINDAKVDRLHTDPVFRLKERCRNRVLLALKAKTHTRKSKTADMLGCDLYFFHDYMLSTWEKRYGKPWNGEPYHVDHITPLMTAKTEADVLKLFHYTNLQLLTPEDNTKKRETDKNKYLTQ